MDAYQFPWIHVHNIEFAQRDVGTMVIERFRFGAPRGVLSTVRRRGLAAHITMLDNLRHLFESDAR